MSKFYFALLILVMVQNSLFVEVTLARGGDFSGGGGLVTCKQIDGSYNLVLLDLFDFETASMIDVSLGDEELHHRDKAYMALKAF